MAAHDIRTRDLLRQFRVFRLHFLCHACPDGNEWSEHSMVVAPSYCPTCDAKCEPYDTEALLEDVADEEDA